MIDPKEIKNKIITKKNLYCLFSIIIIFSLDRYTKLFILNNFTENPYYLNDYININLVWNTGIGFGLFSSSNSVLYNSITFIIAAIIISLFYITLNTSKFDKIAFSIILGGALGNFYDRIIFRSVPDFIDLHYNHFHWFTFNVADIFVTLGVLLYLFKNFFVKNDEI